MIFLAKKLRTTIYMDDELIDSIIKSGVRNVSKYFTVLAQNDLKAKAVSDEVASDFEEEYEGVLQSLEGEWKEIKI